MLENTFIIRLAEIKDAARICEIYNAGILGRTATFETVPRTITDIEQWFLPEAQKVTLVAEREGAVLGWASVSPSYYTVRECYRGVGEYSVYVAPEAQGQGVGLELLKRLITAAGEAGYWKIISRIFPENVGSLKLCARTGFREVGVYRKHGLLDGVLKDVVIVERLIEENL